MAGAMTEDELVPLPERGRIFDGEARAGLGDISPTGRVRFDTLACWLQDVAFDDIADAGLADAGLWVVRRTGFLVRRFPTFRERVRLQTFCSGIGPRWAHRRTVITGDDGADVDAVALWVFLDPETGHPKRFDERFITAYGEAAAGRGTRGRLRHPSPPPEAPRFDWRFRAADLDPAAHVNNAAYWTVLEERLDGEPKAMEAEIEYRDAAQPGPALVAHEGGLLWITNPDGVVHASIEIGGGAQAQSR
jgi:acyl-ACP thioesterase